MPANRAAAQRNHRRPRRGKGTGLIAWPLATACFVLLLSACTGPADQSPAGEGTSTTGEAVSLSPVPLIGDLQALTVDELPFAEPSDAQLPAAQRTALQAVLNAAVSRTDKPVVGLTAALVSARGSWAGAAGVDGAAAQLVAEATFDIASVTKTVTAAEVVLLADAGKFDLDEPASKYINHPLLERHPTVRQLLSHTSGIPDFISLAFGADAAANPGRSFTEEEVLAYITEPLTDPGGTALHYSNSNYVLLGLLIENMTGLTYAQAVQRDLLGALGPRMLVQDPATPLAPLAIPDQSQGVLPAGPYLPSRAWASAASAAGGIAADAPTLADWGYRLYGGRLLDPERTAEMTADVTFGYGLGSTTFERRYGPHRGAVGHDGSVPGYSTVLVVFPAHQLAVAVLIVGDRPTDDIALGMFTAMGT